MKRILMIVSILLLPCSALGGAKKLEPPPEGKTVVYIGRMTGFVGAARPFHLFDGDNYLVRIKGKNYLRYVCDPGEHVFWVAADSRNFVKADLEEGRSYALWARLQVGTWSAGAELQPITQGSKAWTEFGKMIRNTKPTKIKPEYVEKWKANHPDYIRKALEEWRAAGGPAATLRKDEYIE